MSSRSSLKITNNPRYKYRKQKRVAKPRDVANIQRVVSSVPYPETHILLEDEIYVEENLPSSPVLLEHFRKEGRIQPSAALRIIKEGAEIFKKEDTLLEIPQPVSICGDIHGQFYDLITLFKIGGKPPKVRYLFLGDYVDRGCFGIECILLLWSMKINNPTSIYLLRGNHECRHMTENFTFRRECEVKYSLKIYEACMDAFDCLPLAALVNDEFLCMHGGISPEIHTIEEIKKIFRFREPPVHGPMCDILWSDPLPDFDTNETRELYFNNTLRGCSYFFSFLACSFFVKKNKLLSIIRAHEVKLAGYQTYKKIESSMFPSIITVFSAPNYLDVYNNKGAILRYENRSISIKQFSASPHPYWLANFTDALTYTLPFVCEHVLEILMAILNVCDDKTEVVKRREDTLKDIEMRSKIRNLGKAAARFSEDRRAMEIKVDLKGLTPVQQEIGNISQAKIREIREGGADFNDIISLDAVNEKNPAVQKKIKP